MVMLKRASGYDGWLIGGILCAALLAVSAPAQDLPPMTKVENTGEATVYEAPAHVEFYFHLTVKEENLEKAMATALQFEENLHSRLDAEELRTSDLEVSMPMVTDLKEKIMVTTARLRFPMTSYISPDTGPGQFARLCDRLTALSVQMNCLIAGPEFLPADRDRMIASAVTAATENAYPSADAAAAALKNAIYAVDHVVIDNIQWNATPDSKLPEPTTAHISCTAWVRVIYALSGQP